MTDCTLLVTCRQFCDRYGRRVGLVASIVGLLLTELVFIITANFVDYLPGNYWFLLTGFVIEGLLGSEYQVCPILTHRLTASW